MLTYIFGLWNLLKIDMEIEQKHLLVIDVSKRNLIKFSEQAIGSNKIQLKMFFQEIYFVSDVTPLYIKKICCDKTCFSYLVYNGC